MRTVCAILMAVMMVLTVLNADAFARSNSSDILKQGLLGAGAGAVGGAASGAKGGDVWKGALAGAGVNVVGGALLDSMSGNNSANTQQQNADTYGAQNAYSSGYEAGYGAGYKQGYTEGYKEGLKEAYSSPK